MGSGGIAADDSAYLNIVADSEKKRQNSDLVSDNAEPMSKKMEK